MIGRDRITGAAAGRRSLAARESRSVTLLVITASTQSTLLSASPRSLVLLLLVLSLLRPFSFHLFNFLITIFHSA